MADGTPSLEHLFPVDEDGVPDPSEADSLSAFEFGLGVSSEVGDHYRTDDGTVVSVMVHAPSAFPDAFVPPLARARALRHLGYMSFSPTSPEDILNNGEALRGTEILDHNTTTDEPDYITRTAPDDLVERFPTPSLEVHNVGVLVPGGANA